MTATPLGDGSFIVHAGADGSGAQNGSWEPSNAAHYVYIDSILIMWDTATLLHGSATAPVGVVIKEIGADTIADFNVGGTTTVTGLTGLGTGVQTTPGNIVSIDLGGFPFPSAGIGFSIEIGQTVDTTVAVTVLGRVGAAPVSDVPNLLVAGITGATALPVAISSGSVSISGIASVKTVGTDTVKVIPG